MVRKFCLKQPDQAVETDFKMEASSVSWTGPCGSGSANPSLTNKESEAHSSFMASLQSRLLPLLTYRNQRFLHMGLTHGHWSFYWARLAPIPNQTVPTYMRLGGQINGQPLCWHVTQMGALSFFTHWVLVGDVGEEERYDEKAIWTNEPADRFSKTRF